MTCVRSVRTTLEAQPGVESVDVDFANAKATIVANSSFNSITALAALEAEGYKSSLN